MKNLNLTVSLEEALKIILNSVVPLNGENVSIFEVSGRVLYEDVVADIMIPPVDDSAMDGYAVIAEDTHGATRNNPIELMITGEITAGASAEGTQD